MGADLARNPKACAESAMGCNRSRTVCVKYSGYFKNSPSTDTVNCEIWTSSIYT